MDFDILAPQGGWPNAKETDQMARRDENCCTPFKTTCGGQALIEGIMMQGPGRRALVVRRPDGTGH